MNVEESPASEIVSWYAGRTTYRRNFVDEGIQKVCFEERIVIVRAQTFEEADEKIWAEAKSYAASQIELEYELLPTSAIYTTSEATLAEGSEVWSVIREESLDPFVYEEHHNAKELDSFSVMHVVHTDTEAALKARYSK